MGNGGIAGKRGIKRRKEGKGNFGKGWKAREKKRIGME